MNYVSSSSRYVLNRKYNELYHENEYGECIKIARDIEERSKVHLGLIVNDFFVFWELEQSKFPSSSSMVEPLGNAVKRCGVKTTSGKRAELETIDAESVTCSCGEQSRECLERVCGAVADYLVDTNCGALNDEKDKNINCQKYKTIGKVTQRSFKGKNEKFTKKLITKPIEMRKLLQDQRCFDFILPFFIVFVTYFLLITLVFLFISFFRLVLT